MQPINLLDWRTANINRLNRKFGVCVSLGILISVLIMAICNVILKNRLNASQLKLKIIASQHELQTLDLHKQQELVLHNENKWKKLEFLKKLQDRRSQVAMLLDDIVRLLPPEISLDQIAVTEHTLTIDGECNSNSTVVMWLERLQLLSWVVYGKIVDLKKNETGNNFVMEIFLHNREVPLRYAAT